MDFDQLLSQIREGRHDERKGVGGRKKGKCEIIAEKRKQKRQSMKRHNERKKKERYSLGRKGRKDGEWVERGGGLKK